jgi:hypothetical protein
MKIQAASEQGFGNSNSPATVAAVSDRRGHSQIQRSQFALTISGRQQSLAIIDDVHSGE